MCDHVRRIVVCRCGAQGRWSTMKVKVMQVGVDGLEAVKDERWDLTEGPELRSDQSWC
jgi:hypothetical protein